MEILKIENLSFTYPEQEASALDHVSFSVEEGEFIVLCGESGCGKTTLLRLLKRELAPHGEKDGEVRYLGVRQEELTDRVSACDIGYVMQNPENQIVMDKVWHELAFGLENMGLDNQIIRRRVGEMACFFGIDGWFRRNTSELSGGQKQLLNLASIMAMQPRLLILDEPTSQLDPIASSDFIATLVKLNRELGTTIILTEHRLEDVFPAADKVGIMEKGKLLLWENPRDAGKKLKEIKANHKMMLGLPSAVRIYNGLDVDCACPLTVREGRQFLSTWYKEEQELDQKSESIHQDDEFTQQGLKQEIVLSMKDVWFRYERELPDILEGVSLELYKGEIVSILGSNGSGKTTLLSVISHVNHAYKGKIKIFGKKQKAYKGNELYRQILASLPQNPQTVFLKESVREDYEEMGKVMGYDKEEMGRMIEQTAKMLEIEHLLPKHPYDLSGGEQQKAAIGKMLLLKPKILLLDEPTKGIDASSKNRLLEIMRDLKKNGITILMVTHDVEFAAEASDRCGMFFDKEVTSIDLPKNFFCNNSFYTTAANRIARHMYRDVVTCEDVIAMCMKTGRKQV